MLLFYQFIFKSFAGFRLPKSRIFLFLIFKHKNPMEKLSLLRSGIALFLPQNNPTLK